MKEQGELDGSRLRRFRPMQVASIKATGAGLDRTQADLAIETGIHSKSVTY